MAVLWSHPDFNGRSEPRTAPRPNRSSSLCAGRRMPIYLQPPGHDPRGVDGKGHNRLALLGTMNDECALRPTTEATFWDSHDTRKARYGNYGPCTASGNCNNCKRFKKSHRWEFGEDCVFVRIDENGDPWIMNKQKDGWGEYGRTTSWEWLLRLEAEFQRGEDQHGRYIKASKVNE